MPDESTDALEPDRGASDAGSKLLDLMGDREVDAFDTDNDEAESEVEGASDSEEAPPEEESSVESESEEAQEAESEESQAPPKYKVKVQGQELEITLDEALAGYQRQSDYSRKAAKLSEERRSFESEAAGVRQERERYTQSLQALEQALADTLPKEPDWDALRAEDPVKFAATYADWQRRQTQMAAVRQQREQAESKHVEDARREFGRTLVSERDKLVAAIPEWQDEDEARTEKTLLVEYARDMGYSDDQINAVADHRVFVMLRKAMLYDALQTKGKEAVAKGRQKPKKTLEPGGKKTAGAKPEKPESDTPQTSARKRLRSSGRPRDAATAIEGLLPD